MNEITTLPQSVRERLEVARNMIVQNRPEEARHFLEQGLAELARRDPKVCAQVIGALLGYRGVVDQTVFETTIWQQVTEYGLFGIPKDTLLVPVPHREVRTHTVHFIR